MTNKRISPEENPGLCMAPWTHTYISPQSERRLCCASREEASFTRQYIDQSKQVDANEAYRPVSLEDHWNSDYMKSIRRRMMAGEKLPECAICHEQTLNLYTYRQYFNQTLFPHLINEIYKHTDDDGYTTLRPRSFDYRLTNKCNYKCRMCGEQLSSAWEEEKKQYGFWNPQVDRWMVKEQRNEIEKFTQETVITEFELAIDRGEVEEIYWVGGEPLVWPKHWELVEKLIKTGGASKVFLRYNTNLSIVNWKGVHLFDDILPHFKGYNICASIDGTGKIGEFIRTGLNWEKWLDNFKSGLGYIRERGMDSLVMDVTLTLPGLFSVVDLMKVSYELKVKMYVKTVFSFDSSIVMSPLALPRDILNEFIDEIIAESTPYVTPFNKVMIETLESLKVRPNFEESFSDWKVGLRKGREWHGKLERVRRDGENGTLKLGDIYKMRPDIFSWWKNIK